MKTIKIGNKILMKRKEKQITQEQLAAHFGVSKTAVSKWETDQSYPDITLLPIIASFFQISIDDLISYEPQMTKEDIAIFYRKMCDAFVEKPLDDVLTQLEFTTKKYHSCYTLQFYIAVLYINHIPLIKDEKQQQKLYKEAIKIAKRVKFESEDLHEQRRAEELEIYCYLGLQEPKEIFEIKQRIEMFNTNYLLSSAYFMDNQPEKAITTLQVDVFQSFSVIANSFQLLLMLYTTEPNKFDEAVAYISKFDENFEFHKLDPGAMLPIYITIFTGYATQGNHEQALLYLEKYVHILLYEIDDFRSHRNHFFDSIEDFLLHGTDVEIDLPRNNSVIKKSAVSAVLENPALKDLYEDERYQKISAQLQKGMEHKPWK